MVGKTFIHTRLLNNSQFITILVTQISDHPVYE